jgi:hypothetical protein
MTPQPVALDPAVQRALILGALITNNNLRRQLFACRTRADVEAWANAYAERIGIGPFDPQVVEKLLALVEDPCAGEILECCVFMICRHWPCP